MKEKNVKKLIKILIELPINCLGALYTVYITITHYGGYGLITPIPSTKLFLTNTILPIVIGSVIMVFINIILYTVIEYLTDKISFFLFRKHEIEIIEKCKKNWINPGQWLKGKSKV